MSQIGSIQLSLRAGPWQPGPVPAAVMRALRSVEVAQCDCCASTFELTFSTEIVDAGANDFAIVADELLQPFNRVLVAVTVDGTTSTLVDGFVTSHAFQPSSGPDESVLVVKGEDVSVAMDVVDFSREFPALPDGAVVVAILAPWALIGIEPDVALNLNSVVPYDHVPQQAGTDRQTIRQLADQNGFLFYVRPTDQLFHNVAYWGPPKRSGDPVAVLDVATSTASTVESARFDLDARAPKAYFGFVMETVVDPYLPIPVLTTESTRSPAFAAQPVLTPATTFAGWTRKELWRQDELDPVRANVVAQGLTNASTDKVVTGTVEVSPLRLGTVVSAPAVVGVRGAGTQYDGLYYLSSATHVIALGKDAQWSYRQTLTLEREGVGTTTTTLEPP